MWSHWAVLGIGMGVNITPMGIGHHIRWPTFCQVMTSKKTIIISIYNLSQFKSITM